MHTRRRRKQNKTSIRVCVCVAGERVQATGSCPFSINTFPYINTCLIHFEFTLPATPLAANTRHCTSTAVVVSITKYAVSEYGKKKNKGASFVLFLIFIVKNNLSDLPSNSLMRTVFWKCSQV